MDEKIDWRRKIGAHHRGVHPLLIETADHIEELEKRVVVLENALEETFEDCYVLNEFGSSCENCNYHNLLLNKEKK